MDEVLDRVVEIARKYKAKKVILFGSRARGDHSPLSDYDIAIFEEETLSDLEKAYLCDEIEEVPTLKKIQAVFVREGTTDELMGNINREGIVLYEQAGY